VKLFLKSFKVALMRASKKALSVTIRVSHEEKIGIKHLSENMNIDQSELLRRLVCDALRRSEKGCLTLSISESL